MASISSSSPALTSGFLTAAVGAAALAGPPVPPPSSSGPKGPVGPQGKYRFYQCVIQQTHSTETICKRVELETESQEMVPGIPTKIVPIQGWVPEFADKSILRWNLFWNRTLKVE